MAARPPALPYNTVRRKAAGRRKMAKNYMYDQTLLFGSVDAGEGGVFPNVLNLGASDRDNTPAPYAGRVNDAERRTVDLFIDTLAPAAATLTVTVQGSADGTTGWTDVGKNVIGAHALNHAAARVAISPNPYQFLQVTVVASGASGVLTAYLGTEVGK
jgi:hypothetical protein